MNGSKLKNLSIALSAMLMLTLATVTSAQPRTFGSSAPGTVAAVKVPEQFQVKFETTKGDIIIEVHRAWAPIGADQFYNAVSQGFYNDCRFFRVLPGFMVQFGINGNPAVQAKWRKKVLKDDPVKKSNMPGYITYAMAGPNTRTTQLFISTGKNNFLDRQRFAPFGKVIKGMDVVTEIESKYREKPGQGAIQQQGNKYLNKNFPDLDYIKKATILKKTEGSGTK